VPTAHALCAEVAATALSEPGTLNPGVRAAPVADAAEGATQVTTAAAAVQAVHTTTSRTSARTTEPPPPSRGRFAEPEPRAARFPL
jgi:hypothetical protein